MNWIWIALGIIGFFILLIIILDSIISLLYRIKSKPHRVNLQKHKITFEEVSIPVKKNAYLYAWWIPFENSSRTLILIHGWGRNLDKMVPYIRKLHPLGYNLLAFDARSHGSSSKAKRPTVGTFAEDILAAVSFVTQNSTHSTPDVGLIGLSIGGAAAINAASQEPKVKSVITVGAFAHPVEAMKVEFKKRHFPLFIPWLLFKYMHLRFGFDFDQLAPVNNITKVKVPVLLIHGDKDEVVPLVQGEMLAKAGNPETVRLWIVPDKGHSNCETHPQFWEKVVHHLEKTYPLSKRY